MVDWSKSKVIDLKQELKTRGLKTDGIKAELVARLEQSDSSSGKREAGEPAEGESDAKKQKTGTNGGSEEGNAADDNEEVKASTSKLEGGGATKPEDTQEKSTQPAGADKEPAVDSKGEDPKGEAGHGQILEHGHIYMLYRPKVGQTNQAHLTLNGDSKVNLTDSTEISGIDDVAKFEMLLLPSGSKHYRHINIGRKQMPNAKDSRRPFWASVTAIEEDLEKLSQGLQSKNYETKTQGERTQPSTRPAGRGSYVIHVEGEKSKRATHLAYVLSDPWEPGEVQRDLSIHKEGAFVIQVKDPHADGPSGASLSPDRRAQYPEKLQSLFHTKFRLAEPPQLLDYAGAELLLIAAKTDLGEEIGNKEQNKLEDEAEAEAKANKDIYKELRLSSAEHPAAALKGEWA